MAPFTRHLKKSLPIFLCFVFAGLAASCVLLAQHYRGRARAAESAISIERSRASADRSGGISSQEKTYIRALSERYGTPLRENVTLRDAVNVAARMNQDLNMSVPAEYSTAKTPWLPPPPRTLKSRDFPDGKRVPFSLEKGVIVMEGEPKLYNYSISNDTGHEVPMPVLYKGIRWDDAEKLVESAGLRGISDEVDRALAVWRFVAEHRYHAMPVTEGAEEHDTVKFFSCYGYGFCDDAAQAVAGLARMCGLKARIWSLSGNVHVVPEIFAGGRWILLDADFAVYFHKTGDPRTILGVEELGQDRAGFRNAVQRGKLPGFEHDYAGYFRDPAGNKEWKVEARSDYRIAATLKPGEKVVFSNFNWGAYFFGAYPQRVPRYFNGYFDRPIEPEMFVAPKGVEIRRDSGVFTIANSTTENQMVELFVECPFPVVGGLFKSTASLQMEFEDRTFGRKIQLKPGREVALDSAVTKVNKQPTTSFVLRIFVPAGGLLKFDRTPHLITDFQFAELPLLRLKNGSNEFQIHTPDPATLSGLTGEVSWK